MQSASADHPANAGLRKHLEPRLRVGFPPIALPDQVERPYESLGTHPDLVTRLWDELGKGLPEDCRAVFFGTPALIHPVSGIVFAFAGGTQTYAFRLPQPDRDNALEAGASRVMRYPAGGSLDLKNIGEEWVFGWWYSMEDAWCHSAFTFAGQGHA
jgi:hypothetical protein